jgi:hypothetical protein
VTALTWTLVGSLVFCAIPLAMALVNLRVYRRGPDTAPSDADARVFVCVPARDEEANIEACVRSLLAQDHPQVRVLVYDDQSTDATPEILRGLCDDDPRVIPVHTHPLPDGWNGKQHACWRMARAAIEGLERADGSPEPPLGQHERLLFTDADVRFTPDAARRAVAASEALDAPLLSGFPRQLTGTIAEAALVPMMFYLLLGYLPMWRMRSTMDPSTSAGCGQFILMTRAAYETTGGHEAVRDSMHEGVKLPRLARGAGVRSDLFDASDVASVRMYRGLGETWRGFAKNAYEGLGSIGLLVFMTVLHLVGHLLPWAVLVAAVVGPAVRVDVPAPAVVLAALAVLAQLAQRLLLARRLDHTPASAILHPIGVLGMTAVQWYSLWLHLRGRRAWRGRVASGASGLTA